jgi:anti-sigma regulatory factor (Ser/Thr protein kinase)
MSAPNDFASQKVPAQAGRLYLEVRAVPEQVRSLRIAVTEFVERLGWSDADVSDLMLAVGEAGNNAASYGQHDATAMMSIECRAYGTDRVTIDIRNQGRCSESDLGRRTLEPEWHETHGRGLILMRALVNSVDIFNSEGDTIVRLAKTRSSST